jgi:predicted negative regulator of RcsB-dependent stress response
MTLNPFYSKVMNNTDQTAYLLLAFLTAPALAQDSKPAVDVRTEREKLAPQVMAPLPQTLDKVRVLDEASEKDVLRETQKRLRQVEQQDPKLALDEYRKFWQGRSPHPVVGVQAAIKVAQLRHKLKDVDGALLTCDVMLKKYRAEPSSVLLLLQKADVLAGAKRLDEAYSVVEAVLPDLVAVEPQYYPQVSGALLRLAEMNAASGDAAGKQRSRELYYGVEQVYLRWLKAETIPHTWQMFEGLHARYQQVGDEKRADELLPKAGDALLKMEPTNKNPEGADVSLEAARWLMRQGQCETAQLLYAKVPMYGNGFVSQVMRLDLGRDLLRQGETEAGHKMLIGTLPGSSGELRMALLLVLARSFYEMGALENARKYAIEAIKQQETRSERSLQGFEIEAREIVNKVDDWIKQPIQVEPREVNISIERNKLLSRPIIQRLKVRTMREMPISISVDNAAFQVRLVPKNEWGDGVKNNNVIDTQKEVVIEIVPQQLQKNMSAILVLSNLGLGQVSVPLNVVAR